MPNQTQATARTNPSRRSLWGTPTTFRVLCGLAFALLAMLAAWMRAEWGGADAVQAMVDLVLVALPIAAAASAYVTARHCPAGSARAGWRMLALACLSWAFGEAVWSYYELVARVEVPFPSFADLGYLGLIPLAAASLVALSRFNRGSVLGVRRILDGCLSASGFFLISWTVVLGPMYRGGEGSLVERAIGLAYPFGDVVLATLAVLVATRTPTVGRRAVILVLAGILALAFSDSAFSYLTNSGDYATGSYVDLGWMMGFILLGLAAAHPGAQTTEAAAAASRMNRAAIGLPYAVVGAAVVVAALQVATQGTVEPVMAWTAIAIFSLVLARQFLTLRENLVLNRQLDATNRDLVSSQEFRTRLLNTITHDLANPLSPIRIQTELLQRDAALAPAHRRGIELIQRNAVQMSRLVSDLADVSKMQAGRLTVYKAAADVSSLLGVAAESFGQEASRRGVQLNTHIDASLAVHADPERLLQVVYNLLTNALKFTPAGGYVDLRAYAKDADCVVEVRDSGRGLSKDESARLFQPFAQVHARSEVKERGTGLGLYICRGIVEEHEGRIWVESDGPGTGSTFAFRLPKIALGSPVAYGVPTPASKPTRASMGALAALSVVGEGSAK